MSGEPIPQLSDYEAAASIIGPSGSALPDETPTRKLIDTCQHTYIDKVFPPWRDVLDHIELWRLWRQCAKSLKPEQRDLVRDSLGIACELEMSTLRIVRSYSASELSHRFPFMHPGTIAVLHAFGNTDNPITYSQTTVTPDPQYL